MRKVLCTDYGYDRPKPLKQIFTITQFSLNSRFELPGSFKTTVINNGPVSQLVWHVKEDSVLNYHEL